ncbi:hypothetical protein G205_04221 [Arthrobacter nitrophenolicus]|uniref:Uncharacterized protein n=1 Tax=Arthrobacter nitrophenolicus TaxID=683150 RepID=L8TQP2_9MICC|nr:hypothetical protein G205_04221 [Arthrobacter nitrophenolicus]
MLAAVAGAMVLAGCSAGGPAPGASPSNTPLPASSSPPPAGTGGWPSQPFTDAELAAIIIGVAQARNLPMAAAQDPTRLRSGAASGSFPSVSTETTPGECLAFVPENPFVRWADKAVSFAEGGIPVAGGQQGPASTIMITLRSAEGIAKADFGYPEDLVSRCSHFGLVTTESGRPSAYAVQLLAAPPVAERQYGYRQSPEPKGPGDYGSVGLRALAGTLSITLTLAVAGLDSDADAQPALHSMAALAKDLITEAGKGAPSVVPVPANSLTAEQLVELFKGITGPNGEPATLGGASVLGPPPGITPGTSSREPEAPCTFSDEAYFGSLSGAVMGQGQIQGPGKIDYSDFAVVSMPGAASRPYPFDARAEGVRSCAGIQEEVPGGASRQWSPVIQLSPGPAADSSYALAYQLPDGTGEWHVRSGARRGTLSVEAESRTLSQAETQAKADGLAAFFGNVFSRAGV